LVRKAQLGLLAPKVFKVLKDAKVRRAHKV